MAENIPPEQRKERCSNESGILDDLEDIPDEVFIELSGYCYDVTNLYQHLKSTNGSNKNPHDPNLPLWSSQDELQKILHHPGLTQDQKEELVELTRGEAISLDEKLQWLNEHRDFLHMMGDIAVTLIQDHSSAYSEDPDVYKDAQRALLKFIDELNTFSPEERVIVDALSSGTGDNLKQVMDNVHRRCVHAVGFQLLWIYLKLYNDLYRNGIRDIPIHPQFFRLPDRDGTFYGILMDLSPEGKRKAVSFVYFDVYNQEVKGRVAELVIMDNKGDFFIRWSTSGFKRVTGFYDNKVYIEELIRNMLSQTDWTVAIMNKNIKAVQRLVTKTNVNETNQAGYTPIQLAAKVGSVQILNYILKLDPILTNFQSPPLYLAARYNHSSFVRRLGKFLTKPQINHPPPGTDQTILSSLLHLSAKIPYEGIDALIDIGTNPNYQSIMHYTKDIPLVSLMTNIHLYTDEKINAMDFLLERGSDINLIQNTNLQTVLSMVIMHDGFDLKTIHRLVKALLERGANPNASPANLPLILLLERMEYHYTHTRRKQNFNSKPYLDIARELLEAGENPMLLPVDIKTGRLSFRSFHDMIESGISPEGSLPKEYLDRFKPLLKQQLGIYQMSVEELCQQNLKAADRILLNIARQIQIPIKGERVPEEGLSKGERKRICDCIRTIRKAHREGEIDDERLREQRVKKREREKRRCVNEMLLSGNSSDEIADQDFLFYSDPNNPDTHYCFERSRDELMRLISSRKNPYTNEELPKEFLLQVGKALASSRSIMTLDEGLEEIEEEIWSKLETGTTSSLNEEVERLQGHFDEYNPYIDITFLKEASTDVFLTILRKILGGNERDLVEVESMPGEDEESYRRRIGREVIYQLNRKLQYPKRTYGHIDMEQLEESMIYHGILDPDDDILE